MKRVFADTLYWGAILHPGDQYRRRAIHARQALSDAHLVTTEEVLGELLDGLARRGDALRMVAAHAVQAILTDPRVTVHPQSHESFVAGLELYRKRLDKGYSFVDCVSMNTMRQYGIAEVLTNDRHFAQEGYTVLL